VALKLRRRLLNVMRGFEAGAGEIGYRMEMGVFDGFTVAYRGGTADESVLKESFSADLFYAGVPEYRPTPRDVVLDVGAHIGTFALLSGKQVPHGRVIAIEASRETYNYLVANVALNKLDNVTPLHLALTDKRGSIRLHHDRKNWGHSVMKPLSRRGEEVATASLANVLEDHGVARVDFAKFNCEGAEFPILLMASTATLEQIERMLVLYHCDIAEGYNQGMLRDKLESAGFKLSWRNQEAGSMRGWIYASR
jgi:FkbM family methyltransferase